MNILLIDDDNAISNYVKLGLEDYNYNIDVAYDGKTGLKMALENDYDIILLDVVLPGMNGFELCKRIRYHVKAPIILLTSLSSMEDRVLGFHNGADDYIDKPFLIDGLHKRILALSASRKISS
jgi:two-component system, OmpR family, copper resistance phosphate regulon response regulator CusR